MTNQTIQRVRLPAKSRATRVHKPRLILIHTTQGANVIGAQFQATLNWMTQGGGTAYPSTYGPACDIVIGHLGQEAWLTDAADRDYHHTRANWSAGYGASSVTTWGADEYGIAIELAQTSAGERPPAATLAAAARRVAALCVEYDIPPVRLTYVDQLRSKPVPAGIVGHEDLENGRKTGKWDPNKSTFPWAVFIADVKAEVERLRPTTPPPPQGGTRVTNAYIVQPGDNLSKIAARPGFPTVAQLTALNGITNPNLIFVGQVLRLDASAPQPAAARPEDLATLAAVEASLQTVAATLNTERGKVAAVRTRLTAT